MSKNNKNAAKIRLKRANRGGNGGRTKKLTKKVNTWYSKLKAVVAPKRTTVEDVVAES